MAGIEAMFVHTGSVEAHVGAGPDGDLYDAPVTKSGLLDDGVVLAQSEHGSQLVQQSKWYTYLTDAALYGPGTRITVNGRAVIVNKARRRDGGSLGLPDHLECDLR